MIELSVVLPADRLEAAGGTIACLRRQSAAERLELLAVLPGEGEAARLAREAKGLGAARVIADPGKTLGTARAAAVRAASADVVAFLEEHSWPEPGWAEALIDSHRGERAAFGPVLLNANPLTPWSSADFLISYGRWSEGTATGRVDDLPGHHSSYRRAALLELGPDLDQMLEVDALLHAALRARGEPLCIAAKARVAHLSIPSAALFLRKRFLTGRHFAAARAWPWPLVRRLAYALGSPLIPGIRLWRLHRWLDAAPRPRFGSPGVATLVSAGFAVEALGELAGYLLGPGAVAARLRAFETDRCALTAAAPPADVLAPL